MANLTINDFTKVGDTRYSLFQEPIGYDIQQLAKNEWMCQIYYIMLDVKNYVITNKFTTDETCLSFINSWRNFKSK